VQVEVGQLRRWARHRGGLKDKVFLILGVKTEWEEQNRPDNEQICWDFVIDGRIEWHFDGIITRHSEVISAG
jgi:hypothetical protein